MKQNRYDNRQKFKTSISAPYLSNNTTRHYYNNPQDIDSKQKTGKQRKDNLPNRIMRRIHPNHILRQLQRPLGHLIRRHHRPQVRRRLEVLGRVGDSRERERGVAARGAVVQRDRLDAGPFGRGGVFPAHC